MIIFSHIFEKCYSFCGVFWRIDKNNIFQSKFQFQKIRQKKCFYFEFDGFYVITKKIKIVISRKAANWAFWWSRNTVLKIAITQKNLCPGLFNILESRISSHKKNQKCINEEFIQNPTRCFSCWKTWKFLSTKNMKLYTNETLKHWNSDDMIWWE